jgi:flagellar basal body P-ring formation protein FlgA
MRLFRFLIALVTLGFALSAIRAADPVTIELRERASVGSSVVTVGEVSLISGGDENTRAKIAKIDLVELKARESSMTFGRRSVEYRLKLAGFDANSFRIIGAEKSTVLLTKRTITVEEVVSVAKAEMLRHLTSAPESLSIELAQPVVVKLPEVPADERPTITAKPRGQVAANGRVQMDVSVSSGNTAMLSFAIYFQVNSPMPPPGAVTPAGFATGNSPQNAQQPVIIRPRQRVTMEVRTGELVVKAVGEAMQEGRLGQSIQVQNVDSKKTIVAKVTGPSTVEVDIGGSP